MNIGFYINLPVGGVAGLILLVFIKVPETVKPRTLSIRKIILTKLDIIGFVLFAPAAIQVFLALEWGGSKYHWYSATIIGLFCGAGGTAIVFGVWEYYQGDNAMAPFSMLRIRAVWTSCFVMFLFFGCLQIASYYLPIYFQTVRGTSAMVSGVHMLPNVLSQLISTVGSGALGKFFPLNFDFCKMLTFLKSRSYWLLPTLDRCQCHTQRRCPRSYLNLGP